MSKQAGWRTRQHATIQNCGTVTQVIMWKSVDSDAFHLVHKVKQMGQQEQVVLETIAGHDMALEMFIDISQQALVEVVKPPNPTRQIVGVIDAEDDDG